MINKPIGASPRRDYRSDEDGNILAHRGRLYVLCPMSEIVCFPVLNFTYSHVENSQFFALDLAVSW